MRLPRKKKKEMKKYFPKEMGKSIMVFYGCSTFNIVSKSYHKKFKQLIKEQTGLTDEDNR